MDAVAMNLVIIYPDYLFRADGMTFTTGATGYSANNVVTGCRQSFFRAASAVNQSSWSVDLNSLDVSERAPDYAYFGGLNLSIAKSAGKAMTVYLKGSTDNTLTNDPEEWTEADLTLGDLYGRRSEDYVLEIDSASQLRYWRGRIETGASAADFQHELRKLYFGQWWYPDCEPDVPARMTVLHDGARAQRRRLTLNWRGVTNALIEELDDKILKHRAYNPVVLYTREWHSILNAERVFNCIVTDFNIDRTVHNRNNVRLEFTEVI